MLPELPRWAFSDGMAALSDLAHPGILPVVLSLSSSELENRLDNLSIDLGLGYTERMDQREVQLTAYPQYNEHYFLLRKAAQPDAVELQIGAPMPWKDAAALPLCLLTPEMHNRTIVGFHDTAPHHGYRPQLDAYPIAWLDLPTPRGVTFGKAGG